MINYNIVKQEVSQNRGTTLWNSLHDYTALWSILFVNPNHQFWVVKDSKMY